MPRTAAIMPLNTAACIACAIWLLFNISVRPLMCPAISGPASPATNSVPWARRVPAAYLFTPSHQEARPLARIAPPEAKRSRFPPAVIAPPPESPSALATAADTWPTLSTTRDTSVVTFVPTKSAMLVQPFFFSVVQTFTLSPTKRAMLLQPMRASCVHTVTDVPTKPSMLLHPQRISCVHTVTDVPTKLEMLDQPFRIRLVYTLTAVPTKDERLIQPFFTSETIARNGLPLPTNAESVVQPLLTRLVRTLRLSPTNAESVVQPLLNKLVRTLSASPTKAERLVQPFFASDTSAVVRSPTNPERLVHPLFARLVNTRTDVPTKLEMVVQLALPSEVITFTAVPTKPSMLVQPRFTSLMPTSASAPLPKLCPSSFPTLPILPSAADSSVHSFSAMPSQSTSSSALPMPLAKPSASKPFTKRMPKSSTPLIVLSSHCPSADQSIFLTSPFTARDSAAPAEPQLNSVTAVFSAPSASEIRLPRNAPICVQSTRSINRFSPRAIESAAADQSMPSRISPVVRTRLLRPCASLPPSACQSKVSAAFASTDSFAVSRRLSVSPSTSKSISRIAPVSPSPMPWPSRAKSTPRSSRFAPRSTVSMPSPSAPPRSVQRTPSTSPLNAPQKPSTTRVTLAPTFSQRISARAFSIAPFSPSAIARPTPS